MKAALRSNSAPAKEGAIMSLVDKAPQEHMNARQWRAARANRELHAEDLSLAVMLPDDFTSTQELTTEHSFAGQERALAALELGMGVVGGGYNIFVAGLTGAEKLEVLRRWLTPRASKASTPGDWIYVQNFAHPDTPRAISLKAGQGVRLKKHMQELVKTVRDELPKAFRQEAFDQEKSLLREKYTHRAQELEKRLEEEARNKGFQLRPGPGDNILFLPIIDGKPLQNQEEFARLSPDEREAIGKRQQELAVEMERVLLEQQTLRREMEADVRHVERRFCEKLLAPLLATIDHDMANKEVSIYLAEVRDHILDNLDDFKEHAPPTATVPFLPTQPERDAFLEYEVNVVVDNADTQGAPVVVEASPTYLNLFGTIERVVDRGGRLVTNFTRIKAGSLLKAHQGYLLFSLEDAITEPAVWKVLKRTLKSGCIEMETYEPFALFSTSGLKPQPITIDTKVIVVGNPFLYHLLYTLDEEFREIFKVKADFRPAMAREDEHMHLYAQWTATICQQEGLPHFDRSGVERLIEFGSREAGDREKLVALQAAVADVIREAAYWARKEDGQLVSARHVEQALQNRIFRSNRLEEEIRELIADGTLLINIDGEKVGQVNGLSVLSLGGYAFGRPTRVTASVGMGQSGIINVERESRLSGNIHDKGMLILAGYLRNRYGQDKPLTLSASLCFEQSYSGVEGDSASSAELYALLSRLANLPLRQDIAVTGSVNQWGEVQAIGGVNEKIEGFFAVCQVQGLTGRQGVMIPQANIRNLILRDDVIRAVKAGQFHIYPVRTIDEGLAALSGVQAGSASEGGTVNAAVDQRLREMAQGLKEFVIRDMSQRAIRTPQPKE